MGYVLIFESRSLFAFPILLYGSGSCIKNVQFINTISCFRKASDKNQFDVWCLGLFFSKYGNHSLEDLCPLDLKP